jgi:hypothetical protein
MVVGERATADFGVQETVIVVAFIRTVKSDDPPDGAFWRSPP